MNKKHVPSLELCQELDRLCKEKGIEVPETEFVWRKAPKVYADMDFSSVTERGKEDHYYEREHYQTFPAPLVSEQGEWLKDYMEDKENDGEAVPDDMPKADRMGLLWEPNFMQKVLNYLLAEGIITTL